MTATELCRRLGGLMAAAALGVIAVPALAQTTSVPAPPAESTSPAATPSAAPAAILPDIVLGSETAPLTIIEYASMTCPHCADFAAENMPKLEAEYIDTGKVKFIMRPVYFDAVGLWAGILAQCDATKYYPVTHTLLTTQDDWLGNNADDVAANLRKIGLTVGMTEPQMDACWNDRAKIESMVATYQANATADGLQGTPTFIIGGEKVPNQPWEQIKAKIDEKLAALPASATPATPAADETPATPATADTPATPSVPPPAN